MLDALFAPTRPPREFANALAASTSERAPLAQRVVSPIALLVLCLLPRVWMATRIDTICPDGVLFMQMAQLLQQGECAAAWQLMDVNIYPLTLSTLHRAGLDWEMAGKLWGILMASLAVLPLYGWVRRQFDDRVALVAGILYALHPGLIRWSPELMRDSTYWFLATLTLYCGWRAVTEVRWPWFIAAGVTTVLASSTRFEGWFLFVPLAAWTFWRWLALVDGRRRLLAGVAAGLASFAVGAAVLQSEPVVGTSAVSWGGFYRVEFARSWIASLWQDRGPTVPGGLTAMAGSTQAAPRIADPAVAESSAAPPAIVNADLNGLAVVPMSVGRTDRMPTRHALRLWVTTQRRGFTSVYGLLLLGGVWHWRRLWARRDHQASFYLALLVLISTWAHLWYSQETASRYAFTIVIAGIGFAALAALGLLNWIVECSSRYLRLRRTGWVAVVLAIGLTYDVWHEGVSATYESRDRGAELGHWLAERPSHGPVVAYLRGGDIVAYYSGQSLRPVSLDQGLGPIVHALNDPEIGRLIVYEPRLAPSILEQVTVEAATRGYRRLQNSDLPPQCRGVGYCVFERAPEQHVARQSNEAPAPR